MSALVFTEQKPDWPKTGVGDTLNMVTNCPNMSFGGPEQADSFTVSKLSGPVFVQHQIHFAQDGPQYSPAMPSIGSTQRQVGLTHDRLSTKFRSHVGSNLRPSAHKPLPYLSGTLPGGRTRARPLSGCLSTARTNSSIKYNC